MRLILLCSQLNQPTQFYFNTTSDFFFLLLLFALVCTVETMSSFSLPSSNQDQMMSLPQSNASNTPTPESSLDSAGFYFADPFDFSILNKSNNCHNNFIYFALWLFVLNVICILIFLCNVCNMY